MMFYLKVIENHFSKTHIRSGNHKEISGLDNIDKVIAIDQSPIGRTPRSNPATYIGAFTPIRELYSNTALSKERGYTNQDNFHLMLLMDDVLHVRVMVLNKLKCNFYLMYMLSVMNVKEKDIILKHYLCCTKEKIFLMFYK